MDRDELHRVLRISPHLAEEYHPASGVTFLVGEREHFAARGVDVAAVLDAIDGVRNVEGIIDSCGDALSPTRGLQILAQLEARGLVTEVRSGASERLAFDAGLTFGHAEPHAELVDATAPSNGAAMQVMAEALRGAGFEVGSGPGPLVIVAADYLAPACGDQANAALHAGRACFLVKPNGVRPFIGPYFAGTAGQACPRCLTHALDEQRPVERLLLRSGPAARRPVIPSAARPASLAASANLAALHLRTILSHPDPLAMSGRLWTLDFPRLRLVEHRVRHRPQCGWCGDPELQARIGERPISLAPVSIAFAEDGGFRREPPAASYGRLRHLVSPVLGPVTHLHPMPGRHSDAHPVFSSGYLVVPAQRVETDAFDRPCAGKGTSVDQARMSALAEAIERYAGVYRGDEAVVEATVEQLGDEAIHPARLQLFSAAQMTARDLAPPPLDNRTRIAWTPAWSLNDQRRRYVPLAYCYAEAPADRGATFCRPSSNGSAAGNCLEEAILQGLFEAVERDAVAIWWYGRVRRPQASVPRQAAAVFAAHRAAYEQRGWSLWTLDLTHDVRLPVVVAIATHETSDRLALGFGCHSMPELALTRALSELNQVLDPDGAVASPWDRMAASELEHLRPDPRAGPIAPAAEITSRDLKVHVETWVNRLRDLGLETLVVDKTRPDVALNVAQTIIPGLRHVWPRFAAGRLYTVPAALGWAPRPLTEDELNPEPLLV